MLSDKQLDQLDEERDEYVYRADWASAAYLGGYTASLECKINGWNIKVAPGWIFDGVDYSKFYWLGVEDAIGDWENGRV